MESVILTSPFLTSHIPFSKPKPKPKPKPEPEPEPYIKSSSVHPDPWSLSSGNITDPKPKFKNPKNPLSDANARRIINAKARYLSQLRKSQGPHAETPKWIKRTPEQMVQYLEDNRKGHLYGKHVVAAIKTVRGMAGLKEEERDVRRVMCGFVGKLSFREMCVVLKEQRGWREARDFFYWMKLQICYRPSVIVYTIMLRLYGQVGKIKLAEQTFLEMLEAGCEPDEVACGTMLCSYARWGRHKAMFSFYSAIQERQIIVSVAVYNFMLSSLQKKSLHGKVIELWRHMVDKKVEPNNFTYTVVVSSLVKEGLHDEAFKTFYGMKNTGHLPEELLYGLLISVSTKKCNWDEALSLYEDMRSHGIVPSNFTCASLLTVFYKTEYYSRALSLFEEMKRNKIAADEVIYGLLIRIYGKLQLYEDARKTFEETEQLGLLTSEKTYLAMAQVHLNSGNLENALSVIEIMKSRKISLSRFAYIVMLQCYVMKEDLDFADAAFQALSKTGLPDAGSCSDMLNLYVKLNLTEKAKNLIVQIRKDQIDFDEELYKIVMKVFCKEGMLRDAEELTEEMGMKGSFKENIYFQTFCRYMCEKKQEVQIKQLDIVALGHILSLYMTCGNLSKTEEILKNYIDDNGGLSFVNQLVSNFIKEGDLHKAEIVNSQLTKLGYLLEDQKVASLITSYAKRKKLEKAQGVFAAVVDSQNCGKLIYNSMIDAYVRCGKPEEAYLLYKDATESGQDLGAVGVTLVVNGLSNSGKHVEAENIIRKSIGDNMDLDTVAYNSFIKAMLQAGRLQFAASIYDYMLSSGVTPSIQTYNTLISVYGRGQKLDKAIEMFNTARSLGLALDEKAYMNMISYYGKAGKMRDATDLFATMQKEGIKLGLVSYNIMISVHAAAGLYGEVEDLVRTMHRDGYEPNSFTYLSIVQAYIKSGKYKEAEETIDIMQEKGIFPTCAHFNTLLSAFAKAGLMGEAERIYKSLLGAGLTPDVVFCRTLVRGYVDYGMVEEGINFFEKIMESSKSDSFIMSAAVHLYKHAGMRVKADHVLELMQRGRIVFLNKLVVGSKKNTKHAFEVSCG